jgi:hypothetical protein
MRNLTTAGTLIALAAVLLITGCAKKSNITLVTTGDLQQRIIVDVVLVDQTQREFIDPLNAKLWFESEQRQGWPMDRINRISIAPNEEKTLEVAWESKDIIGVYVIAEYPPDTLSFGHVDKKFIQAKNTRSIWIKCSISGLTIND